MGTINRLTSRDIELLKTPMEVIQYDCVTGETTYNNEAEYKKRGLFETAVKIRDLVKLLNEKSTAIQNIVSIYYTLDLSSNEYKLLDALYPRLSYRIAQAKDSYEIIYNNFYMERRIL